MVSNTVIVKNDQGKSVLTRCRVNPGSVAWVNPWVLIPWWVISFFFLQRVLVVSNHNVQWTRELWNAVEHTTGFFLIWSCRYAIQIQIQIQIQLNCLSCLQWWSTGSGRRLFLVRKIYLISFSTCSSSYLLDTAIHGGLFKKPIMAQSIQCN